MRDWKQFWLVLSCFTAFQAVYMYLLWVLFDSLQTCFFFSFGKSDYFAFELPTESKAMLYPPIRFFNSDISEWVSFPNTNKPCCLFPYPCLEAVNVIEVCSCLRSNEDEEESRDRHFEYLRERRRKPWRMETERDITPWWTSVTFRQTGENSGGKSCQPQPPTQVSCMRFAQRRLKGSAGFSRD